MSVGIEFETRQDLRCLLWKDRQKNQFAAIENVLVVAGSGNDEPGIGIGIRTLIVVVVVVVIG